MQSLQERFFFVTVRNVVNPVWFLEMTQAPYGMIVVSSISGSNSASDLCVLVGDSSFLLIAGQPAL
jgi:hypothetical protein